MDENFEMTWSNIKNEDSKIDLDAVKKMYDTIEKHLKEQHGYLLLPEYNGIKLIKIDSELIQSIKTMIYYYQKNKESIDNFEIK